VIEARTPEQGVVHVEERYCAGAGFFGHCA
jgi:hypothetical protein